MKKIFMPQGFTLLEVMMALAVLSLVLVSVFRMSAMSLSMDRSVRFNTVAPLLARQKLSELVTDDRQAPYQDSGRFEASVYSGYRWRLDMVSQELPLPVDEEDFPALCRLEVTITLDESPLSYKVRTYRIQETGDSL